MSIIEVKMYSVKCDRCGKHGVENSDFAAWSDKDYAVKEAINDDWIEGDEHDTHYCPDCYYYDDDNNVIIKLREI